MLRRSRRAPCAEIGFAARSRAQIAGVVLDEHGQPASDIFLMIHPADYVDPQHPGIAPGIGLSTDSRGRYAFGDLPPGRYIVGDVMPTRDKPYAEAYATTATGELIVPLATGERVMLQPLRLTRVMRGTVSGGVVNRSGDPLVGVDVSLWWTTVRGDTSREYPIKTDSAGRFQFSVWSGIQYRVEVGPHDAPLAQVDVPSLNTPITIVLDK